MWDERYMPVRQVQVPEVQVPEVQVPRVQVPHIGGGQSPDERYGGRGVLRIGNPGRPGFDGPQVSADGANRYEGVRAMAGLYGTRRAGERDEDRYRAAAMQGSALNAMSPAYRGNSVPYFQSVRDAGLEGARAQTVLHYGIRRQMQNDALAAESASRNEALRWAEMGFRGDRDRFERELSLAREARAQANQEAALGLQERRLGLEEGRDARMDARWRSQEDWNRKKLGLGLLERYTPGSVARYDASGEMGDLEERPERGTGVELVRKGFDPGSVRRFERSGDVGVLQRARTERAGGAMVGRSGVYRAAARRAGVDTGGFEAPDELGAMVTTAMGKEFDDTAALFARQYPEASPEDIALAASGYVRGEEGSGFRVQGSGKEKGGRKEGTGPLQGKRGVRVAGYAQDKGAVGPGGRTVGILKGAGRGNVGAGVLAQGGNEKGKGIGKQKGRVQGSGFRVQEEGMGNGGAVGGEGMAVQLTRMKEILAQADPDDPRAEVLRARIEAMEERLGTEPGAENAGVSPGFFAGSWDLAMKRNRG